MLGLQRAADQRIRESAADVGPNRERSCHVDDLAAGQAPQGVGGSRIPKLCEKRSIQELRNQRPVAERRKARLGAAKDSPIARGDGPKGPRLPLTIAATARSIG